MEEHLSVHELPLLSIIHLLYSLTPDPFSGQTNEVLHEEVPEHPCEGQLRTADVDRLFIGAGICSGAGIFPILSARGV